VSRDEHFNRLVKEKSPYLLQHAENPVNWYPWGEEAFQAARKEDKPVFLSIGYSTCHWCHVMARESFQDPEVAELMNSNFISIKVDREERPDIDDIYMTVCQMLTGTGGWPLNVILTPDRKPFFAATYIPRENRFGRTGMLSLVPKIAQLWDNSREEVSDSAEKITAAIRDSDVTGGEEIPGEDLLEETYREIEEMFDEEYGGFGIAPKFPVPHKLQFLLRYFKRTGREKAMVMIERTLRAMRAGGIFDQVGGGFHRYSTDRTWLLPHFEKMLYDQAGMIMVYTDAWRITGNPEYKAAAGEIIRYVLRDMTSPEGAFYSAEDADSEGEEGRFYLWRTGEIGKILNERELELAIDLFNIREEGNFREQSTGKRTGGNIPYINGSAESLAERFKMDEEEFGRLVDSIREKLFSARRKRVRPSRDEKVLTDWNGMMIAALARAGAAFDREDYTAAAAGAADFILKEMRDSKGRLLHRFKDGEAGISGFVDDYAFMALGLIELYQSNFALKYLAGAVEYVHTAFRYLWDSSAGGFFTAPEYEETVIARKKQIHDGAMQSGNSVMALNLVRLSKLTGDHGLEKAAEDLLKAFSETVRLSPSAYSGFMAGLDFALGPSHEVVIAGHKDGRDTELMVRELQRRYMPNTVILYKPPASEENREYVNELISISEFTGQLPEGRGEAAAYVCRDYSCERPVFTPEDMLKLLDE